MADTHARENGVNHRKRREASSSVGGGAAGRSPSGFGGSHISKKIKLEDDTPPEVINTPSFVLISANPNTMEAVREKNKALELDMKEKNRRIAYLTQKCESLFRYRGMAGVSFRCLRRQWFQLQDELHTALKAVDLSNTPDEAAGQAWTAALETVDAFGEVRVRSDELTLNLPEWFLTVAKDAEEEQMDAAVALPAEDEATDEGEFIAADDLSKVEQDVYNQLKHKSERTKELLQKLLAAVGDVSQDKTKTIEYAHLLQEKRAAVAETLSLKDQLQMCKTRIAELEGDVEYKETERHRACRDYDRLSEFVKQQGGAAAADSSGDDVKSEQIASDEKAHKKEEAGASAVEMVKQEELARKETEHAKAVATLRENMSILSTKLYQERGKIDAMRRELEKLKVLEATWKKDEAAMIQTHEDKLQQLRDENAHTNEELAKIRHKAKVQALDIDHHMTEKWEKKITKIQAEMSKTKAQMDELSLKNVSLREKISNTSTYRDQLTEIKVEFEAMKRENANLTAQVERERSRADRVQASVDKRETQELTQKVLMHLTRWIVGLDFGMGDLMVMIALLTRWSAVAGNRKNASEKLSDALTRLSEVEAKYQQELREHHARTADVDKLQVEAEEMKAASEASREENDALVSEIETMAKDMEAMRHTRKKLVQQIDEKRSSCKKLHTLLSREEQAKAHCFEELAAARLQVSSLSTVHKHQKAFLEAAKEHVKTIEAEREASDAEKRKVLREAEVAKKIYTTSAAETTQRQQELLQEKRRPCDKCETYRKKAEQSERQLQSAKAATATGEVTDLERFELRDLQKLVKCSVCQDRRKDVIITKCFHMFCKECVDNNLKSRNRKCPTCKKMFGQDDVKAVWLT
ncbi:hypothetical protein BBJ28_00000114 [Nothophytophthora sp. Chile5]|nr:hypothetical protein BBJ28_00000114 [Nothophytophthora sp. Chile5]